MTCTHTQYRPLPASLMAAALTRQGKPATAYVCKMCGAWHIKRMGE